jgi:hypothetical protein
MVSSLQSPTRRTVPEAPEASMSSMPEEAALKLRSPMSTSVPVRHDAVGAQDAPVSV